MAVNSRKFVGYIAHGRLRSVRLTEPTMTTNLPGNLSLADTKYGAQAAASGSRIYRSKYEELWIKLSRGMILSEYLCILRGNVARPVCCKSSQELPLHLLRGSDGKLCMQHALACMPHGVQS